MTKSDTIKRESTKVQKGAMIEALIKSLGVVTSACRLVQISRETHYRWMKKDKKYKTSVEDIENIAIDFVETKLHKQIEKGDTTAVIFFLKTKGKARGYVERSEVTGKDGSPLITTITTKVIRNEP